MINGYIYHSGKPRVRYQSIYVVITSQRYHSADHENHASCANALDGTRIIMKATYMCLLENKSRGHSV